jgi:hypothetical protein
MPDNADAVKRMSRDDLQAVFARQFADDITTVTAGEAATVVRQRPSQIGEEGRALLRDALDAVGWKGSPAYPPLSSARDPRHPVAGDSGGGTREGTIRTCMLPPSRPTTV